MVLNFAPLSWSCWYSTPVKDGVLWERGVSSFVCESMFSSVSLTILQSQFINIISPRFVISLLKQISSEEFGSKSSLILIVSRSVACVFRLWFENKCSQLWDK
jgi:hypothetical protein